MVRSQAKEVGGNHDRSVRRVGKAQPPRVEHQARVDRLSDLRSDPRARPAEILVDHLPSARRARIVEEEIGECAVGVMMIDRNGRKPALSDRVRERSEIVPLADIESDQNVDPLRDGRVARLA